MTKICYLLGNPGILAYARLEILLFARKTLLSGQIVLELTTRGVDGVRVLRGIARPHQRG